MTDFYKDLQVIPSADTEVIKAAYHALAFKHKNDENKLKQFIAAKEVLLDDPARRKYNKERSKLPKTIGNYKVLELIAEGGFGRTYKAEHIKLKTPVCLKQAYDVTAEDIEILMQEAKAIWDLRHYGIPNIRDIVETEDGSIILVMSFIPGKTLGQIIEKTNGLDPEHVAWITERIVNILKYLHFHGVVHGDVKPQNVIVQPETHQVALVDYGLSIIKPSRGSGSKGYTPYFAAPEQLENKPLLPETDFYGLGMTMIYALGGNVEAKAVPSHTPDNMCKFIKNMIKWNVLERPNWQKRDLHLEFQEIRTKDFGRSYSGMKALKI